MLHRPKPLVLLILDGFGYRPESQYNAIAQANTPCWDKLQKDYPMTLLNCSGDIVGLPDDQMGNSEVGHTHIGSGRWVPQDLSRVTKAVLDGSFFQNAVLCQAVDVAIAKGKALHILSLVSPGGVHSHEIQIAAMIELAAKRGLKAIYLHAFLDGRDVPPKSALNSLQKMVKKFTDLGVGRILTVTGRFYAMDRDKRWERVEQAYRLIACGESEGHADSAIQALEDAYARGETDEFVVPTAIGERVPMDAEDSIVFMNFRADRARELCDALAASQFSGFERNHPQHVGYFATLTEYHPDFCYPVAYPPLDVKNCLGEVLSNAGLTQLRLAETEKYAHVTFFLNGGRDEPFAGETRIMVPSPKVRTYDLQPEMSAPEVTDNLVKAITGGEFDVIICNYANCDMVGHTGVMDAAIRAVEAVDHSLQQVLAALLSVKGQMLLTADHGNIELMVDEASGQVHTAHTTNRVPLLYIGGKQGIALKSGGSLSDITPTLLDVLGLPQPAEMTSQSLLVRS
jgi:2,3-bisphosphoglycerate-independent phosphoglycerate mutase